jgi:hypothetical protein
LLGYPEKYSTAFRHSRNLLLSLLTGMFGMCRPIPILGHALRILNALTNRLELFLGLEGGGSCFIRARKPHRANPVSGVAVDER